MSIISKETWEKFTEEEKDSVFLTYNHLTKKGSYNGIYTDEEVNGAMLLMNTLFGKENLQPEPKIRTWVDVLNQTSIHDFKISHPDCNDKLSKKLEATYKISKLIELGYGGMVTEKEWEYGSKPKFIIKRAINENLNAQLYYDTIYGDMRFIAFHTPEQREEFMSYPENVELVEQYYMI